MHFHFVILISHFISIINGQMWSSWSTCESIPNCFRRRVLACDDGEGIRCARDALYEQRAVSFSINGCDGICIANKSQRESSNNLFVAKTRTEYVHNNIESELFILSNRQLRRDHWSSSQAATINQDTHVGRTYK